MSDQAAGGQGWSVRSGRDGEPLAPRLDQRAATPSTYAPPVMAAHADGRWVAGVGWVPADHPYATGAVKLPRPRRRRRGVLSIAPAGPIGRIVMGLAGSATAGVILLSLFGWHNWFTNFLHGSHDVATPASIAGDPLVINGPLGQLTQQVNSFMSSDHIVVKAAGGFYAPPGATSPSYGVFGIKHRGASMTEGDMTDIVDHIASGKYDGTVQSSTIDGVTYTCGNVDLVARVGVACIWDDYDVGGFLVSFGDSDVPSVMALTRMARNAIEGTTSEPTPTPSSAR